MYWGRVDKPHTVHTVVVSNEEMLWLYMELVSSNTLHYIVLHVCTYYLCTNSDSGLLLKDVTMDYATVRLV